MKFEQLPIGSFVRVVKPELQSVIDGLQSLGYRTVGPLPRDGAVVYDDLDSIDQLPVGLIDRQDGGRYQLQPADAPGGDETAAYFDFVVGPQSLKNYLFPPQETVLHGEKSGDEWQLRTPDPPDQPLAVIGPRSCDLQALQIQDRIFLQGDYIDTAYQARRNDLFLAAVNCRRAAATCFCHSMKTGPAVSLGVDLALTELDEFFVVEIGTERGSDVMTSARWAPCSMTDIQQAKELPRRLEKQMRQRPHPSSDGAAADEPRPRSLDTTDLRDLLMNNLEHPRWDVVAQRCLNCANCTMVCPTCFCSSVDDVTDLTGDEVRRERSWASCFTAEHSYMNSGTVRKTTKSRYRQWLTHKLATWFDQFGTSGCVGCGRCITWCPVGIDLTEEVAAIRGESP